jgi:hypothetical protein
MSKLTSILLSLELEDVGKVVNKILDADIILEMNKKIENIDYKPLFYNYIEHYLNFYTTTIIDENYRTPNLIKLDCAIDYAKEEVIKKMYQIDKGEL